LAAVTLALVATSAYAEHIFGPDPLDTTYGAVVRLRQETWDNAFDLRSVDGLDGRGRDMSQDDNFFRLKTSVWFKLDYDKSKFGGVVKLTNEARYFMDTSNSVSRPLDLNEDEIVFDNLYAYANGIGGMVDLSIGRQDFLMKYGEGFLIMDGTPFDGSRTFYFDAAKATVNINPKISVDLAYTINPAKDIHLPSLFPGEKRQVNWWDEEGGWIYAKTKPMDALTTDIYYIYKNEDAADELDLHTVGARAVYDFGRGMSLRGEFAYQTGEYEDSNVDREGVGGYLFVTKAYKDAKMSPKLDLGVVYLSGDDPDTADEDEAWDPLFAGWPKWSELMILVQAPERNIAYWTNLQMYRITLDVKLGEKTGAKIGYNYLRANEEVASPLYADDKDRGHLFIAQVSHKFTDSVDAYALVEYLDSGDFYAFGDDAIFTRWQIQVKF